MIEVPRFWAPRDQEVRLDSGYLVDPEHLILGKLNRNPAAHPTEALAAARCVVLLGEQGMGKSTVVTAQECPLRGDLAPVDLGVVGSDVMFDKVVFQTRAVEEWRSGDNTLTLVLDGYDEAKQRVPHIDKLLEAGLGELPVDRLTLRIACRGHAWSALLEKVLKRSFGSVDVVELQPLRRRDVEQIAGSQVNDIAAFLSAVDAANLGTLASRPLTLNMLVSRFSESGELRGGPAEFFGAGLRTLCDERNESRRAAGEIGRLSPDQRLAVAARLAAASTFGGQVVITHGAGLADGLSVAALLGGVEGVGAASTEVDLAVVAEVLETGLFTTPAPEARKWAHATFADYLAAKWVINHDLADAQVRPLFLSSDDRAWPQTRLAAGWCLSLDPERFRWLAMADPVAFSGDVELPGDDLRAAVVEGLLERSDELMETGPFRDFSGLSHPGLAHQLRRRLRDNDPGVRWVALELAGDCDLPDLRRDLVELTLDEEAEPQDRVKAAYALLGRGRDAVPELKPLLAETDANRAVDDDLLGVGLVACWPQAATTDEVLPLIRNPLRRNYRGAYVSFLERFAEGIGEPDLHPCLQWLDGLDIHGVGDRLALVANAVVALGLRHIGQDEGARDVLSRVALRFADDHRALSFDVLGEQTDLLDDPTGRQALLRAVLDGGPTDDQAFALSAAWDRGGSLVRPDDLGLLIDAYEPAPPAQRAQLTQLIWDVFSYEDREQVRTLLALPEGHSLRPDLVDRMFEAMPLDSPFARLRRERIADADTTEPDRLNEAVDSLLDRFDDGDLYGFWRATQLLSVRVGFSAPNEIESDLTAINRWNTLTVAQQVRLLDASESYLRMATVDPDIGLERDSIHYPTQAAYRALRLLAKLRPEALDQLPGEAWARWAPAVIAATCASWDDNASLFATAASKARGPLTDAVVQIYEAAAEHNRATYLRHEVEMLMDGDLSRRLLDLVPDAGPELGREILGLVAAHSIELARPALLQRLLGGRSGDPQDAEHAAVVLFNRDIKSWSEVEGVLEQDRELAMRVVGRSAVHRESWDDAPAELLAAVYLWMARQFPRETDPQHDDVHVIGHREQAGRRRDGILDNLAQRATREAVAALEHITRVTPEDDAARWNLLRSRDQLRRSTWLPTDPTVLRTMSDDHRTRIVRSPVELLDVVIEALAAIQQRLTGESPEAHAFWNTDGPKSPKLEEECSDLLKNRLHEELIAKGVIVDREVSVRRLTPKGRPRQVDISVTAVREGQRISVPIEVKGSWNRDLESALIDQLVDEYLSDIGPAGIYLVLWPDLESWEKASDRRTRAGRRNRAEVMSRLENTACSMPSRGLTVRAIGLDLSYAPPQSARQ